jgi:hypothetical protein
LTAAIGVIKDTASHIGDGKNGEKRCIVFPARCSRYFPRSLQQQHEAARVAAWNALLQTEPKQRDATNLCHKYQAKTDRYLLVRDSPLA